MDSFRHLEDECHSTFAWFDQNRRKWLKIAFCHQSCKSALLYFSYFLTDCSLCWLKLWSQRTMHISHRCSHSQSRKTCSWNALNPTWTVQRSQTQSSKHAAKITFIVCRIWKVSRCNKSSHHELQNRSHCATKHYGTWHVGFAIRTVKKTAFGLQTIWKFSILESTINQSQ